MSFSFCPAAVVAAPADRVWALLADPTRFDTWWNARTERIEPPGPTAPGQVLYARTSSFGRWWDVTLRVEAMNPPKHQIRLHVSLPLGTVNDVTITATPIDAGTCRLQFG
jgi:uncharacterized protein YndB with AHSA1/START domain